ncbi:MAG TPA: DUF4870 domain-containing protein [Symbiobacteriaceae bacterium]|nr:DUF4870 domain-containing protein [Symbiobacteriaceae bacterium]
MTVSQEERTLAGLVHLGVLFGWLGLAFQIIMLVVYLPKSKFVANHVKQALGVSVILYLIRFAFGTLVGGAGLWVAFNPVRLFTAGFIGPMLLAGLATAVLGLTVLVLVIMAMVKAFGGQPHRYPVIGDLIASLTGE